ncbi:MAG TPA: metal-dependent hydrolase [Gemmatimonadales bacterium]|nr:metal-dependent hydrolase [Gemmatimonadales bacterium]
MPGVGSAQGQRPARAGREADIDPICHTLVGAGLARRGRGRRTAVGTATLLIGVNLPDIDVLAYLDGPAADLAFRRGWTHGVLAMAVLPFLLTGAMLGADRLVRRIGGSVLPSTASARELFVLSGLSILSHPILDTLNTYGVRWLMPFDDRWFYGDALFIVDPWLWLALATGLVLSRRRGRDGRKFAADATRPARLALLFTVVYAGAMALSGIEARRIALREVAGLTGAPVDAIMLSPVPVTPFVRTVVAAQGDAYLVGRFRWRAAPRVHPDSLRRFPRGTPEHPAVAAAAASTVGRRFLRWARFPAYQIEPRTAGGFVVHIVDLRYADRPGVSFGAVSVPVIPGGVAPVPPTR